jgi:hypothetical protein
MNPMNLWQKILLVCHFKINGNFPAELVLFLLI